MTVYEQGALVIVDSKICLFDDPDTLQEAIDEGSEVTTIGKVTICLNEKGEELWETETNRKLIQEFIRTIF